MPAYNRPDRLGQTLESLLSQTCRDFAVVIVDDKPSDAVRAVVEGLGDSRVHYEPNPRRLGMIGNWRHAFARASALFPDSPYFAWVSDHDLWHPRWLEVLVEALDANPRAVVAYPQMQRITPSFRRVILRGFDSVGVASPLSRMVGATFRMTAGNAIYGLFRAGALAQAGVFRAVLAPDRQVLVASSLLGEFILVPQVLWYREVAGSFSYGRQRQMFFAGPSPWHTYLPAHVQHFAVMVWDFAVRGRGRPAVGRLAGAALSLAFLAISTYRELLKGDAIWWRWLGRVSTGAGQASDGVSTDESPVAGNGRARP